MEQVFYKLLKEPCIQKDYELIAGSGTHRENILTPLFMRLHLTPPKFRAIKDKKLHEFSNASNTFQNHWQPNTQPDTMRLLVSTTSHMADPGKELNLGTIFSCGAVAEMISYNSSEQADHFTSVDLCKLRA